MLQIEPYVMKLNHTKRHPTGDIHHYEGFIIDLLDQLGTSLDFKYEITPVEDGEFGRPVGRDGEWNGMIGELLSRVRYGPVLRLLLLKSLYLHP